MGTFEHFIEAFLQQAVPTRLVGLHDALDILLGQAQVDQLLVQGAVTHVGLDRIVQNEVQGGNYCVDFVDIQADVVEEFGYVC